MRTMCNWGAVYRPRFGQGLIAFQCPESDVSAMSTMKIRTPYLAMLSIGMVMMLLGCGLFDDGQKTAESTDKLSSPISEASEDGTAPSAVSDTPDTSATPVASETAPAVAAPMSIGYDGPSSLEERILASP